MSSDGVDPIPVVHRNSLLTSLCNPHNPFWKSHGPEDETEYMLINTYLQGGEVQTNKQKHQIWFNQMKLSRFQYWLFHGCIGCHFLN